MSIYIGHYGYLEGVSKESFRANLPELSPELIKNLTIEYLYYHLEKKLNSKNQKWRVTKG